MSSRRRQTWCPPFLFSVVFLVVFMLLGDAASRSLSRPQQRFDSTPASKDPQATTNGDKRRSIFPVTLKPLSLSPCGNACCDISASRRNVGVCSGLAHGVRHSPATGLLCMLRVTNCTLSRHADDRRVGYLPRVDLLRQRLLRATSSSRNGSSDSLPSRKGSNEHSHIRAMAPSIIGRLRARARLLFGSWIICVCRLSRLQEPPRQRFTFLEKLA